MLRSFAFNGLKSQSRAYISIRSITNQSNPLDIRTVKLAFERHDPPKAEPRGDPIIFLHGLFGSKANSRTVSRVLARDLGKRVYCLDLRNHGDSPHDPRHDYPAMSADVRAFLKEHDISSSIMIGHSMGAKTAMAAALTDPDAVSLLIPVDNAPIDTSLGSSFSRYVMGMRQIEKAQVTKSKDAYNIMEAYEKDLNIQQFLLANLKKNDEGIYKFRIPLDVLGKQLGHLGDFPYHPEEYRYGKPALFIRGTESNYIADEAFPVIGQFFPKFISKDIKCGHWVISEKPKEFITYTKEFLQLHDESLQ